MAPLGRHHAFTLLETLLAMTVIASLSVLVAQAYRVAHEAADGGAHLERAVVVQRVVRLINDQWNDRRSLLLEGADEADLARSDLGVAFLGDRVRFVTATPVLEPRWPLVEASYIIERARAAPGERPRWNLVYQERPITSFRTDRTLDEHTTRMKLLAQCKTLRIEQLAEHVDDTRSPKTNKIVVPLTWGPVDTPSDDQAPTGGSEDTPAPIAARIVGEYQGEPFTCVFVVQALR